MKTSPSKGALPEVVTLVSKPAHSVPGMAGLAYVAAAPEGDEQQQQLRLLTCGADGVLSSRPAASKKAGSGDVDAEATSISTGAGHTPLTCLAAADGVFAVGDESNYVRVSKMERIGGRKIYIHIYKNY